MNFVGKILLIFTMLFSVLFAGLAGFVFATAENYHAKVEELNAAAQKRDQELASAKSTADGALEEVKAVTAKAASDAEQAKLAIDTQTARNNDLEAEKKDAQTAVTVAQQSLAQAQAETAARVSEAESLRTNYGKLETELNELKIVQTEKNARIRELENRLGTATSQNRTLLADNAAYGAFLRSKGFNDDVTLIKAGPVAPKVSGRILQVNADNTGAVISIGSNDGLKPQQILQMYREGEYLGELKIIETDPNRASGAVVGGRTVNGKRLQEGDRVANSIPRGSN